MEDSQQYVIPELRELLTKKGLKILHHNIRGLTLSAYGLKFYFQKPKAFLLELFIALKTH